MTQAKLVVLTLTAAVALCVVPACGDDDDDTSPFAGAAGQSRGGTTSGEGGNAGEPASGGSSGEASNTGGAGGESSTGTGGETSTGGQAGGESGGSPAVGQGGGAGDTSGQGGNANPGDGWYCDVSASSCVCVQVENTVGDCGVFDCCYTYDSGISGLACACSDAMSAACENTIDNLDGTRVDRCPP